MIRIVLDGAGDLPTGWQQEYELHVIPVNIHFGEKMYLQGVELSNAEFYRMVASQGMIPKTSQPSPHQFIEFYRKIAQPGDTILSVHVTSQLSGTYASAEMAAQELQDEFKVYPFDSGAGSAAMGYMCQEARLMDRSGASVEEILRRLRTIRERVEIVLTLNTLDYARMSGRVKTLQAALASILNVKPIIRLENGMLSMAERVRTRARALDHILEMVKAKIGDRLSNVAVVHAEDIETAEMLLIRARSLFNCNQLIMTDLSTSVAANLGPGTVGLVAYPV